MVAHGVPLVYGAYPQILLRVGEHPADSEAGHLEGESVLVLAGHAAGARVVVEHAVSGGVQQQAVVAVGVYVVDVGVAQRGVMGDGLRQRLEAARAGVEDAEGVVAGYPQLVVVQVRVVGIAAEGDRLFQLKGGGVVAAEPGGGHYPEVVVGGDVALCVEGISGADFGQHAGNLFLPGVVGVELEAGVEEDAPVAVFQNLPHVLVVGLDGDDAEVVLVGV